MANLILYYSRKGENYWAGGVKSIAIIGNRAADSEAEVTKWAARYKA